MQQAAAEIIERSVKDSCGGGGVSLSCRVRVSLLVETRLGGSEYKK